MKNTQFDNDVRLLSKYLVVILFSTQTDKVFECGEKFNM